MTAHATKAKAPQPESKLRIGGANDTQEREADRIAERVSGIASPVDTSHEVESSRAAPPSVASIVASGGRPLDARVRARLEPRFGHSFANVRVHDDAAASVSARSMDAAAYTLGPHIVFAHGFYAPQTPSGAGDGAGGLCIHHTTRPGSVSGIGLEAWLREGKPWIVRN